MPGSAIVTRRNLLAGGAAMAGGVLISRSASGLAGQPDLASLARDAWLYAIPLVEVASVRGRILAKGSANVFVHNRNLTNVQTQKVTAPNNDTIYSRGMLDLRQGPVTVVLPATGKRYFSVQLVDMFSNNIAVLGTRTTGPDGGRFVVAGPNHTAPPDAIRAPSDWAFILARTLIDGPADLAAANAVQDGLSIEGVAGTPIAMTVPQRSAAWGEYFKGAGALLAETPPPATDDALLARIAPLGISRTGYAPPPFDATQVAQIEQGVAAARELASHSLRGQNVIDSWVYPPWNLGRFEQDYAFRAQIAVSGLFALPLEEAFYTRSMGDRPDGLFHDDKYHLHFVADALPPVDAFWSMTCYEATPDGQFFFSSNPIERYAIGNRTAGLKRNKDGSLDIWISRTDPGQARHSNWLPAPRDKPFMLSMRAYLPQPRLLTGQYRFPPLRRFT